MNWFESLKYIINNIGKPSEPVVIAKRPVKTVVTKPRAELSLDPSISWNGIVWHHSQGPDGEANDWEGIKRYHTSYRVNYSIVSKERFDRMKKKKPHSTFQKPWSDIGYHGGVELIDGEYVYQIGRPLGRSGAHSAVAGVSNEFNKTHVGLCAIGDFDKDVPPEEQWELCLAVTRTFMDTYNIKKEDVIGHREVYSSLGVSVQKSCPGDFWDMDKFRNEL
jgi:N-acetylmuramoyl-L-alanine amidase